MSHHVFAATAERAVRHGSNGAAEYWSIDQATTHHSITRLLHYSAPPPRLAASAASIFPNGKQFITSSFVSQPLRATPTPNHKSCSRSARWASGLITHLTPFCFARGHQRQSRSSRLGAALISIHVPVPAAASRIAGISTT